MIASCPNLGMPVDIAVCTVWLYDCRLKENVKHLETLLSQSEGSFDRLDRELVTITKVTENSYMIVHVYMISSLLIIIAMLKINYTCTCTCYMYRDLS